MLPSVMPLELSGSGISSQRKSIGDHLTARKIDMKAAEAYQKVRDHLYVRSKYWEGNVE